MNGTIKQLVGPKVSRTQLRLAESLANPVMASRSALRDILGLQCAWTGHYRDQNWWNSTIMLGERLKQYIGATEAERKAPRPFQAVNLRTLEPDPDVQVENPIQVVNNSLMTLSEKVTKCIQDMQKIINDPISHENHIDWGDPWLPDVL
eukprot:TRINITY_DN2810_c0_g1::TRINITY_DN2810_c0_g1_i2::g.5295::m.5295 TRINITY_DN2810_c0_g1::TRINITY_DN2810_c0_g1_i2::g.5295  ORF type:complete len:149 (+),score=17.59 TRINITY_DN2810_c0_g1_i2:1617-2063(+)